jgi:hypothetical protein
LKDYNGFLLQACRNDGLLRDEMDSNWNVIHVKV